MGVRKQVTFKDDFYEKIQLFMEYEDRTFSSLIHHSVRSYMRKSFKRIIDQMESDKQFNCNSQRLQEEIKAHARAKE